MSETAKKTYEQRAANEPTALHKEFAEWIFVQTGFKPDLKTVQLACSLRMDFQASPENQKSLADRKAAAATKAAKAKADKIAKAKAQIAKLEAEIAEPTATVVPAVKTAAKKTAAKAPTQPVAESAPTASAPATKRAPRVRKPVVKKTTPDVPEDFDRVDLDEPATKPVRRTRRTAAKTA